MPVGSASETFRPSPHMRIAALADECSQQLPIPKPNSPKAVARPMKDFVLSIARRRLQTSQSSGQSDYNANECQGLNIFLQDESFFSTTSRPNESTFDQEFHPGLLEAALHLMPTKTVATINSTGRQAASFVRAASAVGWTVKAQIFKHEGIVADELASMPNVELIIGDLSGPDIKGILKRLFTNVKVAFINTTHWGDEVAIGRACADAARKAGVTHYVYSSMPDHSTYGKGWRGLPMWSSKFAVENYVRQLGIPATFVYTGIYNNNFTSLPYPLFRMELQEDGSFIWQAPFHPNDPLPWLDAEHDAGPALLQIFKMGPSVWKGQRFTLAFEKLTPVQCCERFSLGVGRPVAYIHGPIKIAVSVPSGYREHLEILQETLGDKRAPYFGPNLEYPEEARIVWEGHRGIEEYAREIFPMEESNNGITWMEDGKGGEEVTEVDESSAMSEGNLSQEFSGSHTPAGRMMPSASGVRTPRTHPEGFEDDFFVGSC